MTYSNNLRITLNSTAKRQIQILAAHREIDATTLVHEFVAREYATLGLEEPKLDWKSPEAAR